MEKTSASKTGGCLFRTPTAFELYEFSSYVRFSMYKKIKLLLVAIFVNGGVCEAKNRRASPQ